MVRGVVAGGDGDGGKAGSTKSLSDGEEELLELVKF